MRRIQASAAACPLCRAIADVVSDAGHVCRMSPAPEISCVAYCGWNIYFRAPANAKLSADLVQRMGHSRADDVTFALGHLGLMFEVPSSEGVIFHHIKEWLQSCDCRYVDNLQDPPVLFVDNGLDDNRLVFCGRRTPPIASPEMLRTWLTECRTHHGHRCAADAQPR